MKTYFKATSDLSWEVINDLTTYDISIPKGSYVTTLGDTLVFEGVTYECPRFKDFVDQGYLEPFVPNYVEATAKIEGHVGFNQNIRKK